MKPTTMVQELLNKGEVVVVPGVEDPLTARIAERVGFKAVYIGSYGMTARMLGSPDVGLITLLEMVDRVDRVANATNLAIFVDGESGFGSPLNLKRTINSFEKAGAAGMQLNDSYQIESRCPYIGLPDSQVLPIKDHVARIKAANEVRTDEHFMIYSSCRGKDMTETIDRARAFLDAGAASVFHGWEKLEEMKSFVRELKDMGKPIKASCYPFANTHPSVDELADMGYQLIFFVLHSLYAAAKTELGLLQELKETGNVKGYLDRLIAHDELLDILGLNEIKQFAKRYSVFGAD
jgi:2-methylisocitrate lyase-like PEP mutase family enzyme